MCKKFCVFKIAGSSFSRTHVFQQIPVGYIVGVGDALGSKLKEQCSPKPNKIQTSPDMDQMQKRLNCGLGYVRKFLESMMTS